MRQVLWFSALEISRNEKMFKMVWKLIVHERAGIFLESWPSMDMLILFCWTTLLRMASSCFLGWILVTVATITESMGNYFMILSLIIIRCYLFSNDHRTIITLDEFSGYQTCIRVSTSTARLLWSSSGKPRIVVQSIWFLSIFVPLCHQFNNGGS